MAQLSDLYRIRAGLAYSRTKLIAQIEQKKIAITFFGELTGKDADTRKREYTYKQQEVNLADSELSAMVEALDNLDFQIAQNTGEIEALESERREHEWATRREMIIVLGGKQIFQNSNKTSSGDDTHVFSDTLDTAVTQAVENFDDIPF